MLKFCTDSFCFIFNFGKVDVLLNPILIKYVLSFLFWYLHCECQRRKALDISLFWELGCCITAFFNQICCRNKDALNQMAVCPAKSVEASQCASGTLQHQEVK